MWGLFTRRHALDNALPPAVLLNPLKTVLSDLPCRGCHIAPSTSSQLPASCEHHFSAPRLWELDQLNLDE